MARYRVRLKALGGQVPERRPRVSDWTAPGMEEVLPGVHRIPLPLPGDGLKAVNAYAIVAAGSVTLVDPGFAVPEARTQLEQALNRLGIGFNEVERFLSTHVHRDHYTMAVHLRREFGVHVSLGEYERDSLTIDVKPDAVPMSSRVHRLSAYGADALFERMEHRYHADPERRRLDWQLPDHWLRHGQRVAIGDRWLEVVHTPGHTRGHVVFYDSAAGCLFAGDHVLPHITPSIGFESALSPDPLRAFMASLAIVRARPDCVLLPAHGPAGGSVHWRVDALLAHHGRRLDEIHVAVQQGASTVYQVAQQVKWTRRATALDDLDDFNQMLAVGETAAHLTVLATQGRVVIDQNAVPWRFWMQ